MNNSKSEEQINFEALWKNIKHKYHKKRCFHEDTKCNKIIKAHSIQKNRILNKLSENGKLLGVNFYNLKKEQYKFFELVGQGQATTFPGFCSYHDIKIFRPIELNDYEVGNKEQEFIFAYRALAREYHMKRQSFDINSGLIQENRNIDYCMLLAFLQQTKRSLEQLESERLKFNEVLNNKNFDFIYTKIIVFPQEYLIAVSSLISPQYDFQGNIVNIISDFSKDLKHLYLTIFPSNGKTYILLSALSENKKIIDSFFDQITLLQPLITQQIKLTNLLAIHVENFVMSPKIDRKITKEVKDEFIELFLDTIYTEDKNTTRLKNINLFID